MASETRASWGKYHPQRSLPYNRCYDHPSAYTFIRTNADIPSTTLQKGILETKPSSVSAYYSGHTRDRLRLQDNIEMWMVEMHLDSWRVVRGIYISYRRYILSKATECCDRSK